MAIEQFNKREVLTAAKMNTVRDAVNQATTDISELKLNSATKTELAAVTTGTFYGYAASSSALPTVTANGYAYVGTAAPYAIWNYTTTGGWADSGATVDTATGEATQNASTNLMTLKINGATVTENIATPEYVQSELDEIETKLSNINDYPTIDSSNLIDSNAVAIHGSAFDITEYHKLDDTSTYLNLSEALGTAGANIPEDARHGGMTVKFVQSSDNKYVQYRLMTTSFSTTESDWQGVDATPTVNSKNLVESGGVFKERYFNNHIFETFDSVFSPFIEEAYLLSENVPEGTTKITLYYNIANATLFVRYYNGTEITSYGIHEVDEHQPIFAINGANGNVNSLILGYFKISNKIPTVYAESNVVSTDVYNLQFSPSIFGAISINDNYKPSIENRYYGSHLLFHNLLKYVNVSVTSYEVTERYYFEISKNGDYYKLGVSNTTTPNRNNPQYYKKVTIQASYAQDVLTHYSIHLLKSEFDITVNWLQVIGLFESNTLNNIEFVECMNVKFTKRSVYPFYNCGMNIKLLAGIKDIYIPNYDATKHYFIERFCFSDTKTNYQLRIGYSDTENAVSVNQTTIIAAWFLTKSNYTDAQRKTTQVIQNNGVKVLINIQECIDGGLNFEYYGDTVNPFSAASVVRLCTDSYSSKIIQDDIKTKADAAITSVKTINNQSIVGTGNIEIEGGISDWNDIQNKPTFATVATSGNYPDLLNKPTISEGSIIIDNALDPTSQNPISNSGTTNGINQRWIIVSTIQQLKAAFTSGYKRIILDTGGSYIELSEQLNVPAGTIISAYNGFIKRATGYDDWLILLGKGAQLYGLTIDGNKDNVNKTPHNPSIPLWSQVEEIRTYGPASGTIDNLGNIIKDCKIVNGNTGIMYLGWHNVVENCIFKDMASAGVHYSACYHSSVKGCTFLNCCLESAVYEHSEGAVLWSNFTEDSLVENNYFDGCPEFAIGSIDSADNNNIVIQNNRINNTKGIGQVIYGTNAYNIVIRNNFITNCVYSASESYGIYLKRSSVANPPTVVNNNYVIEGNVIWGGGMALYLRASVIKNNTVINYSNAYNEPLKLVLDNCQINGNTFIEGNVTGNDYYTFTLRNCIFESNKISSPRRPFWLDGTERTIFRDNAIQCLEGAFYTNTSNNYGIELVNNVFCKGGAGGIVFAIPDGSKICGNTFLGRSDDSVPVLSVSSTSKNVVVKDNRYIGSLTFEGTAENGCYEDGNHELIGDSSQLLTKHLFSVSNLTYSIQYVTHVMVGQPVILKITPVSGYTLPDTITVQYTNGGNTVTLTSGGIETYQGSTGDTLPWLVTNDYLYDNETGYIYIPYVYEGINIIATGVAES